MRPTIGQDNVRRRANLIEWHRLELWNKLADAAAKLDKGAYVKPKARAWTSRLPEKVQFSKKAFTHVRVLLKLDRSSTFTQMDATEERPE